MFQRYMNRCLDKWLWNEVIAVVDDVAMGSDQVEPHLKLVTEVIYGEDPKKQLRSFLLIQLYHSISYPNSLIYSY